MFTRISPEKLSHTSPMRNPVRPPTPQVARFTDPQTPSLRSAPGISFDLGTLPIFPSDIATSPAPLQRRLAIAHQGQEKQAAVRPSPARRLPEPLQTRLESLSGLSLDDVHVHYNSPQPAQVQALAYTQGSEIHVGPGQEKHLAHETWHAVQQKQGRVKPTLQAKGVAINDDPGLEQEAEQMGKPVHQPHMKAPDQLQQVHTNSSTLQGYFSVGKQKYNSEEKVTKEKKLDTAFRRSQGTELKYTQKQIKKQIAQMASSPGDQGTFTDWSAVISKADELLAAAAQLSASSSSSGPSSASSSSSSKKEEKDVEYPFPGVPATLYRWCSRDQAKGAIKTGIKKYGTIHDGIPTLPKKLTKSKALGGGGVGIAIADRCLAIDTAKIPQIAGKEVNSVNKVKTTAGLEYKILVDIPAEAIKDITSEVSK
jgi:hypothetical protein